MFESLAKKEKHVAGLKQESVTKLKCLFAVSYFFETTCPGKTKHFLRRMLIRRDAFLVS